MTNPKTFLFLLPLLLFLASCDDDDDPIVEEGPLVYSFERNGASTVAFGGQTTRILMGEEIGDRLLDNSATEAELMNMFRNAGPNDEDVAPFTEASLNGSDKSVRGKIAASRDYFFTNATGSAAVRADFEGFLSNQVAEVFPTWNQVAAPGQAGQIADGSSVRYVSGEGLEYNQAFVKSLIGALMLDQAVNNYLSTSVLDEADNRANNDAGITANGEAYTTMEHKWDESFGYVFGKTADITAPLADLGTADDFLNKYLGRVDVDPDYAGIAQATYDAYVRGRRAIVAGDYTERDRQADIIKENLSRVIAVRSVYYLVQAADALEREPVEFGTAFHDLSEAYGFIYSLRFTRDLSAGQPFYSRAETLDLLDRMFGNGDNGFWTVEPATLRTLAQEIAARTGLNVDAAGSTN